MPWPPRRRVKSEWRVCRPPVKASGSDEASVSPLDSSFFLFSKAHPYYIRPADSPYRVQTFLGAPPTSMPQAEARKAVSAETDASSLFVEQSRLPRRLGRRGLPPRHAYHAQHRQLRNRRAGDINAIRIRIEIGRREMEPIIQERQQVVRNDAFQSRVVAKPHLHPQPVQLRPV